MFSKPRKSKSLQLLEVLQNRSSLSTNSQATYRRLRRGYEGEVTFANLLRQQLSTHHIALFDLHLKIASSECQIDCLVIFQNDIYLLEIKNYEGDYFADNNHWYFVAPKREIRNPLHQLNRTQLLFRDFLASTDTSFSVKSYVVFVNPAFHLYGATLQMPIIFPSQLHRFIQRLHTLPTHLHGQHEKLAEKITNAHITSSAYEQIPDYHFDELQKGITCETCNGWMKQRIGRRQFICSTCTYTDTIDNVLIHNIADFKTLFPEKPLTVSNVYSWCGKTVSTYTIRRILQNNYQLIRKGMASFYI